VEYDFNYGNKNSIRQFTCWGILIRNCKHDG
jgi:hypothetical protein